LIFKVGLKLKISGFSGMEAGKPGYFRK